MKKKMIAMGVAALMLVGSLPAFATDGGPLPVANSVKFVVTKEYKETRLIELNKVKL